MVIDNEKDLAQAIKDGQETIEIKGSLKDKTIKIKATGKVAWAVAIGAIGVAVAAVIAVPSSGGAATPVSFAAIAATAPVATATLGLPVTITAISIAIAGGGVGVLNKLRKYKVVSKTENTVILKRK